MIRLLPHPIFQKLNSALIKEQRDNEDEKNIKKGTSVKNKIKSSIYERYKDLSSSHLYFHFKPALDTLST